MQSNLQLKTFTERKQAEQLLADYNRTLEQQVAERTAALQKSEAEYRLLFENSQVCIFRSRIEDGSFVEVNQRFLSMFQFNSAAEVLKTKRTWEFYVDLSDRAKVLEALRGEGKLSNFEIKFYRSDQSVMWGLLSAYFTEGGYIEAVISDISDLKQAEAALHHREQQLRLDYRRSACLYLLRGCQSNLPICQSDL